jgi:hypothetical protein
MKGGGEGDGALSESCIVVGADGDGVGTLPGEGGGDGAVDGEGVEDDAWVEDGMVAGVVGGPSWVCVEDLTEVVVNGEELESRVGVGGSGERVEVRFEGGVWGLGSGHERICDAWYGREESDGGCNGMEVDIED